MKTFTKYIKKNILFISILLLLVVNIVVIIIKKGDENKLPFKNFKEYANDLRSKGLYLQTIEAYKEFLKSSSISKKIRSNIHYFIGNIYQDNLKDFEKALAHYIKIKYIYPKSPLINNINQKIITCLENSGRSREAQLALEESTILNKKNNKNENTIILAKIDSDIITLEDFNKWYHQLPQNTIKEYSSKDKKKILFKQYIGQELMYRMAIRKGFQNNPEIIKQSFEIKKTLMSQKLIQEELLGKINISTTDIKLYYKANRDKYKKPLNQTAKLVQQDIMQERVQEKSQEMLRKMIKANNVHIFEDNIK